MVKSFNSIFKAGGRDMDMNGMVLLAVCLLIIAAPLELGQLAFAFVGALCYAALQASRKVTRNTLQRSDKIRRNKLPEVDYQPSYRSAKPAIRKNDSPVIARQPKQQENPAGKQEYRQQSTQPVVAPTFNASDLESQVSELLGKIAPSADGDKVVQDIAAAVKSALHKFVPEAEVMGFASGDVLLGTAFAVAIPEVDIILSANPSVFVECLKHRGSRPMPHAAKLDHWKLQKSMLRACTDQLTATTGFKFRRSAFKGLEPKVTLLAEVGGRSIPIDFSVNTITPLHNAALLTECGQIDARAKELILLVRRWAKDRGISHAAKGHLSPYAWSLLVVYFLQVWDGQESPVLPNISSFKLSSSLLRKQHKEQQPSNVGAGASTAASTTSVAELFKAFVRFYSESFNWRNEAVSVRAGKRQPPAMTLPLSIVTLQNGSSDVALSIEDPFQPKRNLSDAMTGVTVGRLREELARAETLSSQEMSLSTLLEPWVPAEREIAAVEAGPDSDE